MFDALLSYLTHFFYNNQFERNQNYQEDQDTKRNKSKWNQKSQKSKQNNNQKEDSPTWENYVPLGPENFYKLFKETFPFSVNDYQTNVKSTRIPKIDVPTFFSKFLPQMLFNDAFFNYTLEECMLVLHLKLVLEFNGGEAIKPEEIVERVGNHSHAQIESYRNTVENQNGLNFSNQMGVQKLDTTLQDFQPSRKNTLLLGTDNDLETTDDPINKLSHDKLESRGIENSNKSNKETSDSQSKESKNHNRQSDHQNNSHKTEQSSWEIYSQFDEIQTTIALKILLNGLLKRPVFLCNEIIQNFSLDTFFNFMEMKELYPKKQTLLLKYYDSKDAKSVFEYHIEIVWLSYAILGKLFTRMIRTSSLQSHIKIKKESIRKEHLKVLRSHENMYKNIIYLQGFGDPIHYNSINDKSLKQNLLETESGIFHLEKFIEKSNLIFKTNEIHLIELGFATIGQLISNANDSSLDFLVLSRTRIDLQYIVSKFILCSDNTILTSLGRLIMTLICKNLAFIDELLKIELGEQSSFINELIFICFQNFDKTNNQEKDKISLRIQYLNILFVIIIYSKIFSLFIINRAKDFNFLDQLVELMKRTDELDLPFLSLQLLFGLLHHEETHGIILPLSSMSKESNNQIVLYLKRLSFSPYSLNRYYSLLIWRLLCRSQNQAIMHYLVQQEQMLSILTLLLQEEKEISLTRLNMSILYEIVIRKNNSEERKLLITNYNLLFETTQIFKEGVRYVRKYAELHPNQRDYPSLFLHYIGLLRDVYFLFVAFCNYDEHSDLHVQRSISGEVESHRNTSITSSAPVQESNQYSVMNQLVDRYNMIEFFKGYLFVLLKMIENGNKDYVELHKTVKTSMRQLFKIGSEL